MKNQQKSKSRVSVRLIVAQVLLSSLASDKQTAQALASHSASGNVPTLGGWAPAACSARDFTPTFSP